MTKDEALSKFKARQIKEAMNQTMNQFYSKSKKIKKVDINDGGVVNLIMR